MPNQYGGRENLEAVEFLQQLNTLTHAEAPGTITVAEESTSWPGVSRAGASGRARLHLQVEHGVDARHAEVLRRRDPVHRRWAQNEITFSMLYAFTENFILPYSHDEVVHGKRSMLDKMPGDGWQKAATLRALYAFMYSHPGKKLLFMGDEFGQWREWNNEGSLDWDVLEHVPHNGIHAMCASSIISTPRAPPSTSAISTPRGFQWIDGSDVEHSVIAFMRRGRCRVLVACVFNWTPVVRDGYRVGVPEGGAWRVVLNTDEQRWGGSGAGSWGRLTRRVKARTASRSRCPFRCRPWARCCWSACASLLPGL